MARNFEMVEKTCAICGRRFTALADRVYCSVRCRKNAAGRAFYYRTFATGKKAREMREAERAAMRERLAERDRQYEAAFGSPARSADVCTRGAVRGRVPVGSFHGVVRDDYSRWY